VVSIGNPSDLPAVAPAPASAGHSRLGRWARRRARQLLWVVAILAVALVLTAAGVMLSRAARLFGLPDIGDPFDVPAFRALNKLPEDQDAAVLIRKATSMVSQMPSLPAAARQIGLTKGWPQIDPQLRAWLEANRDSLALYRQGVELRDGIVNPGIERGDDSGYLLDFGPFHWLAKLEGARLEDQGDMEGAWGWYRTILRFRVLVMRRGSVLQRYIVDRQCENLASQIESWSANRKTAAPMLRRALDDVLACEPKPEWDAYSLKTDYLYMMADLNRPDGSFQYGNGAELDYRFADMKLPPEFAKSLNAARRFMINDPELSRRVLRLTFANWLARAQDSDPRHRSPSVVASFKLATLNSAVPLFTTGPDAPESARRMAPDDLARRLLTTRDAQWALFRWPWWSNRLSEKRAHARLVMLLAEELYRRERGAPPPSDAALVGTYLSRLPDDGSDDLADGQAQRVEQATGLEPAPN
jgi:hypothetical protein